MNSMKSWSVYLPNGDAVVVVGEIECRDGKFYFKDGDEVVAVFNEDKVCGVKTRTGTWVNDVFVPDDDFRARGGVVASEYANTLFRGWDIAKSPKPVYPQGDEG